MAHNIVNPSRYHNTRGYNLGQHKQWSCNHCNQQFSNSAAKVILMESSHPDVIKIDNDKPKHDGVVININRV